MRNRIVENWLTSSNEIAYQIPFCQLLVSQGYKVVHITRHGPMEQGKDVIALAPDNTPCAFQLKAGNITQGLWRAIRGEVEELIELPIVHPSIPKGSPHRSYLVTNGQLSEEVRREIDDRNKVYEKKRLLPLHTIVGGELVADFEKYFGDFLPADIPNLSLFLTLYQDDGKEPLDKESFSKLIESLLPLETESKKRGFKSRISRAVSSLVVVTSYVLKGKYDSENHIAIIDAWILLLSYIFLVAEKFNLNKKYWEQSANLVRHAIESEFDDLIKEMDQRKHCVEGDALVDPAVYKVRMTFLAGYLSAFEIYRYLRGDNDRYILVKKFLDENPKRLILLGEGMIPLFLSNLLYRKIVGDEDHTKVLLAILLERILRENELFKGSGLPDPYHDIEELIKWKYGLMESIQGENFEGISYSLKTIVWLMVKMGLRQELEASWLRITHVQEAEFVPDEPWQFFRWRNREEGHFKTRFPNQTESWKRLKEEVSKNYLKDIPNIIKKYPEFLSLFLCVFPHRLRAEVAVFLYDKLEESLRA